MRDGSASAACRTWELPGRAAGAQAGLAALGLWNGRQGGRGDVGRHAPAAFGGQSSGDGALVALAAQRAAQRIGAHGSGSGRCGGGHGAECRPRFCAAAAQGHGGRDVKQAVGACGICVGCYQGKSDMAAFKRAGPCVLPASAAMGRHPKTLGDALLGALQCSLQAGKDGAQAAAWRMAGQSGREGHAVCSLRGRNRTGVRGGTRRVLRGQRGRGGRRQFVVHGRDVRPAHIIRKVEFNEALLQKF